jgi:cell division protein FtsB
MQQQMTRQQQAEHERRRRENSWTPLRLSRLLIWLLAGLMIDCAYGSQHRASDGLLDD